VEWSRAERSVRLSVRPSRGPGPASARGGSVRPVRGGTPPRHGKEVRPRSTGGRRNGGKGARPRVRPVPSPPPVPGTDPQRRRGGDRADPRRAPLLPPARPQLRGFPGKGELRRAENAGTPRSAGSPLGMDFPAATLVAECRENRQQRDTGNSEGWSQFNFLAEGKATGSAETVISDYSFESLQNPLALLASSNISLLRVSAAFC